MDDAVGQLGGNGPAISHLVSGEDGVGFGVKIFLPLRSPAPGAGDRKGRPDTVSLTLPPSLTFTALSRPSCILSRTNSCRPRYRLLRQRIFLWLSTPRIPAITTVFAGSSIVVNVIYP